MQRAPLQTADLIGEANSPVVSDVVAPVETPIGRIYVASSGGTTVTAVGRTTTAVESSIRSRFGRAIRPADALPEPLASAIAAHLRGDRSSLSFDLGHLPDLDRAVLLALLEITRGDVRSYGQIARQIGQPRAAKEVGQALNQNPIPVLIPCHRVIHTDGRLGGYRFGSQAKQALLHAEGAVLMEPGVVA